MDKFELDRIKKLDELKEQNVNPFGGRFDGRQSLRTIAESYAEEEEGKKVKGAGRISAMRQHGKSTFVDIKDWTGKIQVYFKLNQLGEDAYQAVRRLDLGDIIGVEGGLFKTRSGEITIFADELTVLSKALLPPPEKWHGLRDVEIRYRQRSVDLFTNDEVMRNFMLRSRIIRHIQQYLDERGFVEVETPMMQTIPGGATARPFITHHNSLDMDLYLRISPELYLKRLLVGGMEKVYEINRNFRNEGISTKHNPEFTMMEVYQAYADYNVMMDLTEGLITSLVEEHFETSDIPYGDKTLNMASPWARRKYVDLLKEYGGVDLDDDEAIMNKAKSLEIKTDGRHKDAVANDIFEALVEPRLTDPTFVLDYPITLCPLTKACDYDPRFALRFELYIASMEMANAYSELNDPMEQEKRFQRQLELAAEVEGEVKTIDEDFLTAMKHGMPPAGGLGIGIDRLVMILTNTQSIRDVILFPLLRLKKEPSCAALAHHEE